MEMKAKDTYRCECRHGVSEEALSTLMTMYQPLVGPDSILIYLTLAAEAQSPHGQDSLQRLFALTGIPADTFEKACARLEEYMLMRTYMKETDTKNSYVFVLSFPLSAQDFVKNAFYMSRYQKVMGQTQTEISAARAVAGTIPVQEYKDVTHVIKNMRTDDYERSVPFIEIKPKFVFSPDDESVNFDYHSFDMKCSTLVFPAELRSGENMDLIGRLAVVHGISVEKMIILVKDCVSLSTMKFDTEKLKIKAARAQGDVKPGKDIYDMSPDLFLSSKQNGAPISFADSQMVGRLSTDMHFSNEVINIMLEYILHVSQNRLNPRFVDMVAGEWARDGVKTREQALQETKKQLASVKNNRTHVKIDMPAYMKKQKQEGLPETKKASEEQIQEALEMQRKMKERHGNGQG